MMANGSMAPCTCNAHAMQVMPNAPPPPGGYINALIFHLTFALGN
jgi:hypothetical protein